MVANVVIKNNTTKQIQKLFKNTIKKINNMKKNNNKKADAVCEWLAIFAFGLVGGFGLFAALVELLSR